MFCFFLFTANATMDAVTIISIAATSVSPALPNSGTDGDGDVVAGDGDEDETELADGLEEPENTERPTLVTPKTSPFPES
jgi:hypothetical protein